MTGATREQVRRLKNTVMGASHRLSLLAGSGELPEGAAAALAELAGELVGAAQRLERLLSALERDR